MAQYDPNTPVRPTPEGTVTDGQGRRFTAGRDHVTDACAELLRTGEPLAVDIETVGTDELSYHIKVVTLGTARHVVALDPRDPKQANVCRWTLHEAGTLVFHGGAFDIPPMVHHRLMALDDIEKVHDTLVYARMAEPDTLAKKTLTACAARWLGYGGDSEVTIKAAFKAAGHATLAEGFRLMDIDAPVYLRQACMDTALTAELLPVVWQACLDRLTAAHPFTTYGVSGEGAAALIEREQIVNRVMLRRSAIGLPVDTDYLSVYRDEHEREISAAALELDARGISPGNGANLMAELDRLGEVPADWPRTAKTRAPSSKAENLETLDHPLVHLHLRYKELTKVRGYLEKCELMARIDGRVHPQVKVLGASATGRMSYGSPELQQFPSEARAIIVAEDGRGMTSIDWSSIEPVVMANAAHDGPIIDAYTGGGDLYAPVVEAAKVPRKVAKVVLLGAMYGQGLALLASTIGVDETEAAAVRGKVMSAMPGIKAFLFRLKTVGNEYGMVPTISGRILPVPRGFDGKLQGYKAQNYFCQGSAYDVLAETIAALHRAGMSEHVVMALHDELVVDTEAADYVRRVMETAPPALVQWAGGPVVLRTDRADMGRAWASV